MTHCLLCLIHVYYLNRLETGVILDGGLLALQLNAPRGGPTLSRVPTLDIFESPAIDKLRQIQHAQNREGQYFASLLWKTQGWGVGNPFSWANSSP